MEILFLGTGAAEGIPCIGCNCERCNRAREVGDKNLRGRASFVITSREKHKILVDTPPEIVSLLNRYKILDLSAIFLSHEHFDHVGGLREFEYWRRLLDIFVGFDTIEKIEILQKRLLSNLLSSCFYSFQEINIGRLKITPFKVKHHVPCYGFIFSEYGKKIAIFSDSDKEISNIHLKILTSAKVVIINTPEYEYEKDGHHMTVKDVIELNKKYNLNQIILTHINHDNLLHHELEEKVKNFKNIKIAYDGLTISV